MPVIEPYKQSITHHVSPHSPMIKAIMLKRSQGDNISAQSPMDSMFEDDEMPSEDPFAVDEDPMALRKKMIADMIKRMLFKRMMSRSGEIL